MPTKPDNEVDISLIVGLFHFFDLHPPMKWLSFTSFTINFLSDAAVNLLYILNPTLR